MRGVAEVVSRIEALGGCVVLKEDGSIRYRVPRDNPESKALLDAVKAEKQQLIAHLRARAVVPMMPHGVSLVEWRLKEPPVAIEMSAVVINSDLFAHTTLEQLRIALAEPRRWVGWSVPQLIDRLAQVGVRVTVDRKPNKEIFQFLEKWVTGARTKDEKRIPVGRVPPAALDLEADPRIGAAITPSAGPRTRHIASVAAALLGRSGDMGSATEPAKS